MIQNLLKIVITLLLTQGILNAEYLQNVEIAKDSKSDWMELKSGEWLRGEFKGFYSNKIEFDSDEFDLVKFDIDDVNKLVTVGNSNINLNRKMPNLMSLSSLSLSQSSESEVSGLLGFSEGTFTIKLADGTSENIPKSNIASISSGELKESNYWSASVYFGIDVLTGNTQQVTITSKASAERRTSLTRLRADYLSTFTQVDLNITTADNNRLTGSFDMYQTKHFFWRLASVEAISDPLKNIDTKYTFAMGLGYDILYTDDIDWSVTVGPGYQQIRYSQVEVGEQQQVSTALFFLDTRYKQELSDDIDFLLNYNMYLVNEESGTYVHHAEFSLETELVSDFTIDMSLFWDKVESP
ncbi:DUF481 domain-containing protein, partial [Sulfurimonas sp. SAG-AH-194-C21]